MTTATAAPSSLAYKKGKVPVIINEQDVSSYTVASQEAPVALGKVVSRVYDGEKTQRHFFVTEEKEYEMGSTSDAFQFVNHADVLRPMLEQGWKIQKMHFTKGAARFWAMLTPKDPRILDLSMDWDESVWKQDEARYPLTEGITVTSSLIPGTGIRYAFGFWRQICTNGLVAEILGLGRSNLSHRTWAADSASAFLAQNRIGSDYKSPMIGNVSGLSRAIDVLDHLGDADHMKGALPMPIQNILNPLLRLPNWYITDIQEHLKMRRDHREPGDVSALDLLNALTSPISARENSQDREYGRHLMRLDSVARPLSQLIAFMSLLG